MIKVPAEKLNTNRVKNLYWNKEYSIEEIAKKLSISFWSLYSFMCKNGISRRSPTEVNYATNKDKPRFKVKKSLDISEQNLKVAGVMLYWAEGTLKGNTVDFANSNPHMIKVFLKFLREICGVDETRLRVYLYVHTHNNLENVKEYWYNITGVSLSQFTKPYIRRGNLNKSNRKLPCGLIHIRYNDKRLLELIINWINEYVKVGR